MEEDYSGEEQQVEEEETAAEEAEEDEAGEEESKRRRASSRGGWGPGPRFRGRGYGPGPRPFFGRPPRHMPPPPNHQPWGHPPHPGMMGGPPGPFGPGMMGPGGPPGPMRGMPPNHMMGDPFGGPPAMGPPPNVQNMPGPELWVETKTEEGKSYFYHARTRETTWTRPQEGPHCKVITQSDVEAMAQGMNGPMGPNGPQNGQMGPNMGMGGPMGPGPMGPNGPMGGPLGPNGPMGPGGPIPGQMGPNGPGGPMGPGPMGPGGPIGPGGGPMGGPMGPGGPIGGPMGPGPMGHNMPPGQMGQIGPPGAPMGPPGIGSMNHNTMAPGVGFSPNQGPPQGNNQGIGNKLEGNANAKPNEEGEKPGNPPSDSSPIQSTNHSQPDGNKPGGVPVQPGPPGQFHVPPPGFPQWPMPGWPPQWPGAPSGPPPQIQPSPEMMARAAEWTSHRAPDGRTYYYNAKRQESVWEKPQPLKDIEAFQKQAMSGLPPPMGVNPMVGPGGMGAIPGPGGMPNMGAPTNLADINAPKGIDVDMSKDLNGSDEARKVDMQKEDAIRHVKEKEQTQTQIQTKPQDKSRPVSSTPISGTPWCVVWTGDGRVFFYNPTAHSSVWERPEQLIGRSDVDRAVSNPPDIVAELQSGNANQPNPIPTIGEKRNADSTDESDGDQNNAHPTPAKKAKHDEGKEAAIEAEVRAARERAMVPLELRIKSFREMLAEKEVSAFSTWEKELHKIVFDSRYLVLTSKERKQVFDKYVRERAEEERKEKRNRLRQKKDDFRALLEEAKLHSKSSFSDFAGKYGKDERFKGIEKMRERESLFLEYIAEVRKREKEEKAMKREQIKKDFFAMLKECKDVDRHTRWSDVKKKLDSDPRYKAVDGSSMREDYFRDYIKVLKDERRKEKDKDRDSSRKKDKRDKEKDRDKDREEKDRDKEKSKKKEGESNGEEEEDEEETEKQNSEEKAAREKAARAEASIKEREREVQRALATSLRDRDKEREFHKRDEAIQHFNALLADLVRNPELSWREVKKQLKKDHRWSLVELLSKEDKESLFASHTEALALKRRDKFREMLDELGSKVTLTSIWRDVRKLVKEDPRYSKFSNADKCEREFNQYIRDRTSNAKQQFRTLLQETRSLTHRTMSIVRENSSQLADIESQLREDSRYFILDHIGDERKQLLMTYLEELDKRGPPPPPTASEPSRRLAK